MSLTTYSKIITLDKQKYDVHVLLSKYILDDLLWIVLEYYNLEPIQCNTCVTNAENGPHEHLIETNTFNYLMADQKYNNIHDDTDADIYFVGFSSNFHCDNKDCKSVKLCNVCGNNYKHKYNNIITYDNYSYCELCTNSRTYLHKIVYNNNNKNVKHSCYIKYKAENDTDSYDEYKVKKWLITESDDSDDEYEINKRINEISDDSDDEYEVSKCINEISDDEKLEDVDMMKMLLSKNLEEIEM